ncbi:MAG: hypothetical protein GEV10_12740 [Streptosporangiales bacterium]|nr:hypothetical protein [Streptosporangiales bacterium]
MTDELLARFTNPAPEFGPLPLWWWSGDTLTEERLRWQLEQLVAQEVRQAVVICLAPTGPLYGSMADDPPFMSDAWFALLDGVCAYAEELGFRLWMYDQLGFSGANLQGRLIADRRDFAGLALYRTGIDAPGDAVVRAPTGHVPLAAYAVPVGTSEPVEVPVVDGAARWTGGPARVTLVHAGVSGFDYFGAEACAALLDQVHGELERRVGLWFGRSIHGFFQDELPAMPTWGRDFAETFADAYGYDLVPWLWALWEGTDPKAAAVRRDYHEHRARLARRAFFDPHDAWFAERGLLCGFDQRSPAREGDPVGGVEVYGDYLGTHAGYGAPGSDHWGDPKVHSSLAHANGSPRTWIEAFHSSGWGGTLEETYDWLAPFLRRGATLYDPHAVYYGTSGGWWEWAPPSTCWRQPYWPSYHVFARAVARLCSVLTAGTHVCDTVLLSPTTTAQAYLTLDGPLTPATAAAESYHALNGVSAWYAERRGVLERAGVDHDVLDDRTVASGEVVGGSGEPIGLRIGAETYRTVVLPDVHALHAATAGTLARFAEAGGRVVCAGTTPEVFLGGDPSQGQQFAAAVASGRVAVADSTDAVVDAVVAGPVRVSADAPHLLRSYADAHVVALTAHDDRTGTAAPVVSLEPGDWSSAGFPWDVYWERLRTIGYRFVPPAGRCARVRVDGLRRPRAQRWDPGTGHRTEIHVTATDDGGWTFEVAFDDGAVALVVLAEELPAPTRVPLGAEIGAVEVPGPWRALATSTLDNRWGDLGAVARDGVLPIEVWRMEHAVGAADAVPVEEDWQPVVAGDGPFAEVRGPWHGTEEPAATWQPAVWSLSRGIRDDPVHEETLGPKGRVPEEFLDWRDVPAGARVAVRTHLPLPDRTGLSLAVGANAAREVSLDGVPLAIDGDGYQSFSPLPAEAAGTTAALEIVLRAEESGPVRASFAVVADPAAYRRPEWLVAGDAGPVGRVAELTYVLTLDAVPAHPRVQLASDGPCALLVNGVEVGRQGDFSPYPGFREVRVQPYDLGEVLRVGDNVLTVRVTTVAADPTAALVDSLPRERGGLGLVSGPGWRATTDGADVPLRLRRRHPHDPRFVCAWPRPHPLPGAAWLEPAAAPGDVVVPVVPGVDVAERFEWLRLAAPAGTTALRVPTALEVTATVGGRSYEVVGGQVTPAGPLAPGTPVLLRLRATDGRSGGALLDGAVEVTVAETEVPLASWADLGLRALGGEVRYRTTVRLPAPDGRRTLLDLGEVRGCADVSVNGTLCGRLVWGPWTADVTDALRDGDNEIEVVVRGTLAGYLDDASPTRAIVAGQVRTGLFGPVRLLRYES